jgi:S1-C subfamily serine protease
MDLIADHQNNKVCVIDGTFLDKKIVEAELVGSDPFSDHVVIKIDPA